MIESFNILSVAAIITYALMPLVLVVYSFRLPSLSSRISKVNLIQKNVMYVIVNFIAGVIVINLTINLVNFTNINTQLEFMVYLWILSTIIFFFILFVRNITKLIILNTSYFIKKRRVKQERIISVDPKGNITYYDKTGNLKDDLNIYNLIDDKNTQLK